jgi:threonine dehydratase
VAETTYRLGLRFIDDVVLVSEAAIGRALGDLHRLDGITVEGSAAAAAAALVEGRVPRARRRVVIVLTGSNIDEGRLKSLGCA